MKYKEKLKETLDDLDEGRVNFIKDLDKIVGLRCSSSLNGVVWALYSDYFWGFENAIFEVSDTTFFRFQIDQ